MIGNKALNPVIVAADRSLARLWVASPAPYIRISLTTRDGSTPVSF